jgi:hypothetical protein
MLYGTAGRVYEDGSAVITPIHAWRGGGDRASASAVLGLGDAVQVHGVLSDYPAHPLALLYAYRRRQPDRRRALARKASPQVRAVSATLTTETLKRRSPTGPSARGAAGRSYGANPLVVVVGTWRTDTTVRRSLRVITDPGPGKLGGSGGIDWYLSGFARRRSLQSGVFLS